MALQEVDLKTGGDHYLGTKPGEMFGTVPRVVGKGAGKFISVRVPLFGVKGFYVVGQTLGALADGAVVDRVAANWVHSSSATAGAKRDDRPKGVVEGLPLLGLDMLGDLRGVLGVASFGQPGMDMIAGTGSDFFGCDGLLDLVEERFFCGSWSFGF